MKIGDLRKLPRCDLKLPVFGLGGAPLGGLFRALPEADATALLEAAWARGVRHFDTAPYYGYTRSEHRLGRDLSARPRDAFVLSTKVGRLMRADATLHGDDGEWAEPLPFRPEFDYSHDGVMRSFEDSLQRLQLARIDIVYVHDIGAVTHGARHAETWQQLTQGGGLRALDRLRREGTIAAVGLGVNEWQVAHTCMQVFDLDCMMLAGRYTLLEQTSLVPFLADCWARGTAVIVAGPFNSGILAGGSTYDYAAAPPEVARRAAALRALCAEFELPLAAAALQFPLAHPAVVACVAGARSATELAQNIDHFERPIAPAFWQALHDRGLVDARAPLPSSTQTWGSP